MDNPMFPQPGDRIVIQEAMGYILGTVSSADMFGIVLGDDAIWARDFGVMTSAMETGVLAEIHHIPNDRVKDHAIRHWWPWPHKIPSRTASR